MQGDLHLQQAGTPGGAYGGDDECGAHRDEQRVHMHMGMTRMKPSVIISMGDEEQTPNLPLDEPFRLAPPHLQGDSGEEVGSAPGLAPEAFPGQGLRSQ